MARWATLPSVQRGFLDTIQLTGSLRRTVNTLVIHSSVLSLLSRDHPTIYFICQVDKIAKTG